jgi:hypothetical protein
MAQAVGSASGVLACGPQGSTSASQTRAGPGPADNVKTQYYQGNTSSTHRRARPAT